MQRRYANTTKLPLKQFRRYTFRRSPTFQRCYCLFGILLSQSVGVVVRYHSFFVLRYHPTTCFTNLAALLTTTSGLQTVQRALLKLKSKKLFLCRWKRCDVYILQLGCNPVVSVDKLVQKKGNRQLYTKGENYTKYDKNIEYTK